MKATRLMYLSIQLCLNFIFPGLAHALRGGWFAHLFPAFILFIGKANVWLNFLNEYEHAKRSLITFAAAWVILSSWCFYVALRPRKNKRARAIPTISLALLWASVFIAALFFRPAWLGIDIYRISGLSMAPTLLPNELIVIDTRQRNPEIGDLVVILSDNMPHALIKRVSAMPKYYETDQNKLWLLGDNPEKSTDSRTLGRFNVQDVKGSVLYSFKSGGS